MNPYIVPTLDSLRAGGAGKPQAAPAAPRQTMPGTLLLVDVSASTDLVMPRREVPADVRSGPSVLKSTCAYVTVRHMCQRSAFRTQYRADVHGSFSSA